MNMSSNWLVATEQAPGVTRTQAWPAPTAEMVARHPSNWETEHQALRNLELHVLEQWRAALESGDAARVGRLVELGHAVREALHRTELSPEPEPSEPRLLRLVPPAAATSMPLSATAQLPR